jgi:hypothetical protein
LQISQGYIIRILQHFATKLWNITNFVMLFHAMMEFCLDLLRSKFWLIGERSIALKCNAYIVIWLIYTKTSIIRIAWSTSYTVHACMHAHTRVKTLRLMQYWRKQDWTMFCCPHCSHLSTILNNIVEPESGVTILFNIVDNCEQCGQQNIVQSCFHQYCINLSVFTRVALIASLCILFP